MVIGRDGNGEYGGRVTEMQANFSSGDPVTLTGDKFRIFYGLKSTLFTLS